jgi:hypothetical protein
MTILMVEQMANPQKSAKICILNFFERIISWRKVVSGGGRLKN